MALTVEQQAQIEYQIALEAPRRDYDTGVESRRTRLELIRLAKETLIENNRNKPVDDREIAAADITTFAENLNTYING